MVYREQQDTSGPGQPHERIAEKAPLVEDKRLPVHCVAQTVELFASVAVDKRAQIVNRAGKTATAVEPLLHVVADVADKPHVKQCVVRKGVCNTLRQTLHIERATHFQLVGHVKVVGMTANAHRPDHLPLPPGQRRFRDAAHRAHLGRNPSNMRNGLDTAHDCGVASRGTVLPTRVK